MVVGTPARPAWQEFGRGGGVRAQEAAVGFGSATQPPRRAETSVSFNGAQAERS